MDIVFLMLQNISPENMDHKIILYLNHFLHILNCLKLLYVQKLWRVNVKVCQMKL